MRRILTIHIWSGVALMLFGAAVMAGWVLRMPEWVEVWAGGPGIPFNVGMACMLAGYAAFLPMPKSPFPVRGQVIVGWILTVLSALVLFEYVAGVSLGIDLTALHAWHKDENPNPGRMAPAIAFGFLLAGLSFLMMQHVSTKLKGICVQIFTFIVFMMGFVGVLRHALHLGLLYSWIDSARATLPSSIALIMVSVALWSSWSHASWYRTRQYFREDEKIGFLSAGILILIGLTIGINGFSSQQSALEKTLSDSLQLIHKSQTTIFQTVIWHGIGNAEHAASGAQLVDLLHELNAHPANPSPHEELHKLGQGLTLSGFTGIEIYDAEGRLLFRTGHQVQKPDIQVGLGYTTPASLVWGGALYLNTPLKVIDGGNIIGSILLEQPLPLIAEQFSKTEGLGVTSEMAMCIDNGEDLLCFPQRRRPEVYRGPRLTDDGKPTPMNYAVSGLSGIYKGADYRGHNVIAAYGPLTKNGLGFVVKQDAEELYTPIREQLQWNFPLLLLLVVVGAILLRSRATPLVSRLLASERSAIENELRVRTVIDNVGEGIITMNEAGVIESFNGAASTIFGYTQDEAIGMKMTALMPAEMRELHEMGMKRFIQTGEAHVIGKKTVELPGLHKDGTVFQLELAVNEIRIGKRRLFVGMVRDITERKQAEIALMAEKERLHVTLSSIGDAVITTDTHGTVTYLNPVAEAMTGWSNAEGVGLPLEHVFKLVNEHTNAAVPNPVDLVLQEKKPTAISKDIVLVQRGGGAKFAIEDSAAPIRDRQGGIIGVVLVFRDVTQARKMVAQMTHQAAHDALTGLINRREFERRLEQALETGKQDSKPQSVLYLDLDQFKVVNDTCGHIAGDELLRQLTSVLQEKLRQTDTLARLGGDEFGVLLESCPTAPALRIAEILRQTVSDFHFVWLDKVFPIGVSIGLVTINNGGASLADVLRMADAACYVAKDKGRNRIHVYSLEDKELAQRHGEMGWIGRIQKALDDERFVLYSQKILPLERGLEDTPHYEILIRMKDEDGSIVPPMAFIPAAERYGLMPLLDRWVVKNTFSLYAGRHALQGGGATCAINLSGASICDDHFLAFVREQFDICKLPPSAICFEITETSAIANLTEAAAFIRELKLLGCRFALDDFGSGMSFFAYLKHLPVDYLKIDGGFVKDMVTDSTDHAMVEAINHIGHVMGIQTIAEFVENDEILDALRKIGVDFAQGYGVGRPQPYEIV